MIYTCSGSRSDGKVSDGSNAAPILEAVEQRVDTVTTPVGMVAGGHRQPPRHHSILKVHPLT